MQMYTVEQLQKQHKTFKAAKAFFKIKAASWQKLCDKLNTDFIKDAQIQELRAEVAKLQAQIAKLSAKSDLDLMLTDLVYSRGVGSNEVFEAPEAMEQEPEGTGRDDWAYFESVLKRRYYRLSKRYHPDNNGSDEQMKNLGHAYDIARTFVKTNGGLEK